jgi:hypothetical protein
MKPAVALRDFVWIPFAGEDEIAGCRAEHLRGQLTTLDAAYSETDANPIRSWQSNPYDSEDEVGAVKLMIVDCP